MPLFQGSAVTIVSDESQMPTVTIRFADGSEMSVPRAEVLPDPAPSPPEAPVAEAKPEEEEGKPETDPAA